MEHYDASIAITAVHAGKLRRYHTLPLWKQLMRPSIVGPNLRDMLLVGMGFIESFFRLVLWRPDVVFTKGGFVCLPVGIAARVLRIPIVIHDSDAHPGLTNRLLAGGAAAIATGAPLHHYSYPEAKSHYVGIPISDAFHPLSEGERRAAKAELGFDQTKPLIVVTGGGLGARRLNDATVAVLDDLLPVTSVLLISGVGQYDELASQVPARSERFELKAFVSEGMATILGAADIVVARAGATTIMELAALAKPTILVPNAYLTGGHQLKNAAAFAEDGAAIVLDEALLAERPAIFVETIMQLLGDQHILRDMQRKFFAYAKPQAAADVADLLLEAVKKA